MRPLPALLISMSCACGGPGSVPTDGTVTDSPFTRTTTTAPLINPRSLVSPSTGETSLGVGADPCAAWDPVENRWRVFFTFADFQAEEAGGISQGIFGGTTADGVTFEPYEDLVVSPMGTYDTSSIETCELIVRPDPTSPTGQRFYLYTGGSEGDDPNYTVTLSTSTDGEHFSYLPASDSPLGLEGALFQIDAVLPGVTNQPGNYVTDQTITVVDDVWHMWTLCIQQIPEPYGGICHSTSTDGVTWQHDGLVSGLDRAFPIQPTVFHNPATGLFEMYVIMDTEEEEAAIHDPIANLTLRVSAYYHATSEDGMLWTYDPVPHLTEDLSLPWEDGGLATGPDAELHDGEVFLFYPTFTSNGQGEVLPGLMNWPVHLATRPADR